MKAVLLKLVLTLGSEFLFKLVYSILDVLKGREDNTLDNDADAIRKIMHSNKVIK